MWGKVDRTDLLQTWADELTGFEGDDIRSALTAMRAEHLDYPPTLFEFAALCRDARLRRTGSTASLPAPKTRWDDVDPRIRDEVGKYRDRGVKSDPKDWARQILAEADAGTYRIPIGVQSAKEALGIA